ncbi:TetR/AcrR family transcriptional regulator [Actinokineospora sp. NBRC 105648]|uniref:TetR/AcrR family transcriptional regulator n=1 Tax=Actinokineospora sp. NBRC 105648 TaxID=3032206 RepID=UPI0024A554D9|nr:TetR/AcrR family transcriptional regulator [Actinokineospora sp. NBRC 105648]GLZ40828.1 TetR family transcriptional regulator [Actinokineospora sp. NBRC 105648]
MAETPVPQIAQRPKRADGRRNYDALLVAARTAFAEHGSDASLEDIAHEAGVAIGTLYRHFPTRATLVEAATRDGLEVLVSHARDVADRLAPLTALTDWMRHAVVHFSTFRGLVGILAQSMYDEGTPSHAMCAAMHTSGADLLRAAQRAGEVRADLTADELFGLLSGAAWVRETTRAGKDETERFIELVIEGIAVRTAGP